MGALIQTKGTQRLAKLFRDRFKDLTATRGWRDSTSPTAKSVQDVFGECAKLLDASDALIAQNAGANWPADMGDLLYPSATFKVDSVVDNTTLKFKIPGTLPSAIVKDSAVCCLNAPKKIPKRTKVSATPNLPVGGILTVGFTKNVTVKAGDFVSFALGKHERLVRRWRWYLENDLTPENDRIIRLAIFTALDSDDFKRILFQTVEDTQRAVVTPISVVDPDDELTDDMEMHILLMTQSTTAPDKLDPQ